MLLTGYDVAVLVTGYDAAVLLTGYDVAVLLTGYDVAVLVTGYDVTVLLTGYDVAEAVLALVGGFARLETVVGQLGVLQRLKHTRTERHSLNSQQLTSMTISVIYCRGGSFYVIQVHS